MLLSNLSNKIKITQLSKKLGISRSKIYKMTMAGEIPFSKPFGKLLFDETAIDQWLEKRIINSSSAGNGSRALAGAERGQK